MCGLVVVKARDFRPDIFRALMFELTVQQSHRGPDGSNVEIIENHNTDNIVGLGHNLLSIIDSKSNIQPMYSWDTRYCIVFSGEIYNYEELRVKVSYSFKSETDTEILLVLYEKYGVSMLDFIKGMFAFVIYDSKEQKFFVARDRYGQKPLYYWTNERVLVISTEIKSILKCKEYSPSVDRMAAIQYFLTMDTFNWQTMFKGIKIFPPGNYASISIEDRNIDLQQYSYPKFCNSDIHRLPSETYADNLKFLLEQSVNRHTTENLNWALQLSGGLDSNTLAAVLVNIGHKNVGAYTCAYQLPGSQIAQWDESKLAVDSAKTLGLTANVVMLTPEDYIESLVKLVSVMEEPKGNSCMAQYHLVQNIAQDNYRIVWGGEGADE